MDEFLDREHFGTRYVYFCTYVGGRRSPYKHNNVGMWNFCTVILKVKWVSFGNSISGMARWLLGGERRLMYADNNDNVK